MKKSYLMIAVAALAMVSCAQDDQLKSNINEEKQLNAINFASFAQKATRGTTKPDGTTYVLEDYHQTMAVYGTKKDVNEIVQTVFNKVVCTYAGEDGEEASLTGEWSYSPARYWDKQSSYNFAAFAPAFANMDYSFASGDEVTDAEGKFISTANYVVKGQNLMSDNGVTFTTASGPAKEYNVGFNSASGDVDIMIADYVARTAGSISTVDLCFRHTLAKLIVAVKAGDPNPANASADGYIVKVMSVNANNYKKEGSYGQDETKKWSVVNASGDLSYKYNASGDANSVKTNASADAIKLTEKSTYFIESLVMPQNIGEEQEIALEYEIMTQGGNEAPYYETFKRTVKVSDIFSHPASGDATRYNEETKYIITLTIDPQEIKFDAGVYDWGHIASSDAKPYLID